MTTLGITLYGSNPGDLVEIARQAEAVGFEELWVGEHVVAPADMGAAHPYSKDRVKPAFAANDPFIYDHWVMIGALLSATTKIEVHSGIYLLPLRHPLITARGCVTAQQIGKGRFGFGVGSGWLASEFAALDVPFEERAGRYDEILDLLPKFFAGGAVAHDGRYYRFPACEVTRQPIRIPIWLGGTRPVAVRRAAAKGDGWYGTTIPFEDNLVIRDNIEARRRELGRDKLPFRYTPRVVGPSIGEALGRYRGAGFEHLVIPWGMVHPDGSADDSLDGRLRSIERAAAEAGLARRH